MFASRCGGRLWAIVAFVALVGAAVGAQPISTFPYNADFETLAQGSGSGTTVYNFTNGWTALPSTMYWQARSGPTSSSNTGPSVDHNPGTAAGKYVYLETSQGSLGAFAMMLSPTFNFSTLGAPVISFWYHMYGATMGNMHIDLVEGFNASANGSNTGTTFTSAGAVFVAGNVGDTIRIIGGANAGDYTIATVVNSTTVTLTQAMPSNLSGMTYEHFKVTVDVVPSWTDNQDLWQNKVIPLNPHLIRGGSVQLFAFIIRGVRGSSFTGDMAVDDVTVTDGANDVGVTAITTPVSGPTLGATEVVTVTLRNFGSNPQSNIPVKMTLNSGTPVTEFFPGPLAPNATAPFVFTATVDMSAQGGYTLRVETDLATDQFPSNNATTINVYKPIGLPYSTNFDSGPDGWTTYGSTTFALGTPAKPVINSAFSGPNSWVTGLTASYNNGETGGVQSPAFDFTNYAAADPWIFMRIWWNSEFSWDGAVLQSSIDGGATWQNVGAYLDPGNWYTDNTIDGSPGGQSQGWTGRNSTSNGSGTWVLAQHELTGLGGQPAVVLRIAFGSDTSVVDDGFAFDDVEIRGFQEIDLRRNSTSIPSGTIDAVGNVSDAGEVLNYEIHNTGDGPLALTGTPAVVVTPGLGSPVVSVVAQPVGPVAAQSFLAFGINVTPAIGPFEFTVSIDNDDPNEDPYTFTVSGTGYLANATPEAAAPAGSSFVGGTGGPFSVVVNPGSALASADIEVTDAETDQITVTSIVAPSPAPTGVVAPTIPAPGHPIMLSWTGTADAANPPGNYTWVVTVEDAGNGTPVNFDVTITIPDLPPTHGPVVGQAGAGGVSDPYTTGFTETLTGATTVDLSSVSDPNVGQVVTIDNQVRTDPGAGTGFTFALAAGVLRATPAGTLTPADLGVQEYTITISDGTTPVDIFVAITVNEVPSFVTTVLPDATQNTPYSQTVTGTGGTGTLTFTVNSGSLPLGLSVSANGDITGISSDAAGTFNFLLTVTDELGVSSNQAFTLELVAPAGGIPTITTTSPLPNAADGGTYGPITFQATGGVAPYTWSVTGGVLPTGLTLSAAGELSGTATGVGTSTFTVQVTDSANVTNSGSFSITVVTPPTNTGDGGSGGSSGCVAGAGSGLVALLAMGGIAVFRRRRK